MKLEYLNVFSQYIIAVYHSPAVGWQYTIFLEDGKLFAPKNTYSSAQEAYSIAKNVIHLAVTCEPDSTPSF